MEPRGLTFSEIRRAVEVYAPDRLETFDSITSKSLTVPTTGEPLHWNNETLSTLLLFLWIDYNPRRAN